MGSYAGFHAKEDVEWGNQHLTNAANKKYDFANGHLAGVSASKDFLYIFHRHNVTWDER